MSFQEWWDTEGTRMYAETHEERARQTWDAARTDLAEQLSPLLESAEKKLQILDQHIRMMEIKHKLGFL